MPEGSLPTYPETEARSHLTPKQKAELVARQGGVCAGCGVKPRHGWEFDHSDELWEGGSNAIDNWQALGSRKDCDCHKNKTSKGAGRRAKMKRIRKDTATHATRMQAKATVEREAYKRQRRESGSRIKSRGFSKRTEPFKWPKRGFGK